MKRSAPLKRHTRLAARGGLTRRAPLRAVPKPNPVGRNVRHVVWRRSEAVCDVCAAVLPALAWQAHHRQLKSQSGAHTPENLLALCGPDHRWIHEHPGASYARGWLVPGHADPARTPVLIHGTHYALPTRGGWQPVHTPKGDTS